MYGFEQTYLDEPAIKVVKVVGYSPSQMRNSASRDRLFLGFTLDIILHSFYLFTETRRCPKQ